jgi:hypothetical protein
MRKLVLASAVLLAFGARPVQADQQFYDLTVSNMGSGFNGPFIQVEVDRTSSTMATVTFTTEATKDSSGFFYLMHTGGAAGINVNAATFTVTGITASNSFPGFNAPQASLGNPSGSEDGFGKFNAVIDLFDGYPDAASQISFVVTNTSGTWATASAVTTPNSLNHILVAQIGAWDGNFADGFTNTGFADNAIPKPPPLVGAVPAPPSVILLATGAVGMFVRLRRRGLRVA